MNLKGSRKVPQLPLTLDKFERFAKLPKIYEYTAFYMTSWGELFCRVFSDKKGVTSVQGALHRAEEQLDLPISSGQVGFLIPRLARKHIR